MFARIVVGHNSLSYCGSLEKIMIGVAKGVWHPLASAITGDAQIVRAYNVGPHGCAGQNFANTVQEREQVALELDRISGDWRTRAYVDGGWLTFGGNTPVVWNADESRRIAAGWELYAANGTATYNEKNNINIPNIGAMTEITFLSPTAGAGQRPWHFTSYNDILTYTTRYKEFPFLVLDAFAFESFTGLVTWSP